MEAETDGATESDPTDPEDRTDESRVLRRRKWRKIRRVAYCVFGVGIGLPLIAFWIAYLLLDVRSPQDVLASLDKTVVLK